LPEHNGFARPRAPAAFLGAVPCVIGPLSSCDKARKPRPSLSLLFLLRGDSFGFFVSLQSHSFCSQGLLFVFGSKLRGSVYPLSARGAILPDAQPAPYGCTRQFCFRCLSYFRLTLLLTAAVLGASAFFLIIARIVYHLLLEVFSFMVMSVTSCLCPLHPFHFANRAKHASCFFLLEADIMRFPRYAHVLLPALAFDDRIKAAPHFRRKIRVRPRRFPCPFSQCGRFSSSQSQ